jgi:ribosomal protein S18 acetylase RimI-like enzyme
MVSFKLISTSNNPLLPIVHSIYEEAFPPEEKVDFSSLLSHKLTDDCAFKLYAILHNNETCGMLSIVEYTSFVFIFYLAIAPTKQGYGIGKQVLDSVKNIVTLPIVLEVEHATNESSKRRIEFYTRNGFHLNKHPYLQPALHHNTLAVPMHIMSYPSFLSEETFLEMKTSLYKWVYKVEN